MGLLDGMMGEVMGQVLGGQQGDGNSLVNLAQALIEQNGGLNGLLEKFQQAGFAEQAASWVGTGSNLPINADQIAAALGNGGLVALATKFGLSGEQVNDGLADMLPRVIDQLTPNGSVENDSPSLDLGSLLGGLLK